MFPDSFHISIRGPINTAVQSLVVNYGFVFKAISQTILQAILFIEWIVRGLPWWLVIIAFAVVVAPSAAARDGGAAKDAAAAQQFKHAA